MSEEMKNQENKLNHLRRRIYGIFDRLRILTANGESLSSDEVENLSDLIWSTFPMVFDRNDTRRMRIDLFNKAIDGYVIKPSQPRSSVKSTWVLRIATEFGTIGLFWIDANSRSGVFSEGKVHIEENDKHRSFEVWPIRDGYLPLPTNSQIVTED